jgi:hypothetical protein
MLKHIAAAIALAALAAPCAAGSVSNAVDVNITLLTPGLPPPATGGGAGSGAPPASDLCVSQSLSSGTGAVVRVVCRSGRFVSIEPSSGTAYLGVHGGSFRYYFANAVPENLRYLGSDQPWVGPGTVTSFRINYPEGLDGLVEMQVGF